MRKKISRECANEQCRATFQVLTENSRQRYCHDKCRKASASVRKFVNKSTPRTLLGFDPAMLLPTVPADWFDNTAVLLKDIPTLCGCTWSPVNYHNGPGKWYLKYRWNLCPAIRSHSRPVTTSRPTTMIRQTSLPR